MDKLKKLGRRHKEFLVKQDMDHHQFLFIAESAECYKFYYKKTGKTVDIRR